MANNIVRYLQVAVAEHEPQNPNILWLKPVEGGFSFYWNQNGIWKLMKLMDDQGSTDPEDDKPMDFSSEVGPDTVGTDQIIDNSIMMRDLNDSVKDKIQKTYVENDESLHMDYDIAGVHASNQAITVEEEEEP